MGNFAEDFLEKLSKQKAGYDLWNNIIEDLNAKSAHASRLERENAKLTKIIEEKPSGDTDSPTSGEKSARVSLLEEKVYKLQEEITELLRTKSSTGEKLIETQNQKQELEKKVAAYEEEIGQKNNELENVKKASADEINTINDLKTAHETVSDEYAALQLTYNQLEKRYMDLQTENGHLTAELLRAREQMAELANSEAMMAAKLAKMQEQNELEAALRNATLEPMNVPGGRIGSVAYSPRCSPPVKKINEFAANKGEINEVQFSQDGYLLATAGDDREIHIYDVSNPASKIPLQATLKGCNSAVSSVAFASNRKHILAASKDYAARIWDIGNGKVLKTLTGHTGSVSAARYLTANTAVTGSSDRTLRIWDLTKLATLKTMWPGSTCTDVASLSIDGTLIASAHFNKQVHFTDHRQSNKDAAVVTLSSRVTGLAASPDFGSDLLAVTRDNEICLLDIRQMTMKTRLMNPNFRVVADYTRCAFSVSSSYFDFINDSLAVWWIGVRRWCKWPYVLLECPNWKTFGYWFVK